MNNAFIMLMNLLGVNEEILKQYKTLILITLITGLSWPAAIGLEQLGHTR